MGDIRASGYETSNDAAFHAFMSGPEVDTREGLEIDREYRIAMDKVGLQGINNVSENVMRCLDQKAANASKAKVLLNKALSTYDAGGGMISTKGFRRGLEDFGLQFTDDQVTALFGCFDGNRSGFINFNTWVEKCISQQKMTQ